MMDNEIVKAAEICFNYGDCRDCPYYDKINCRYIFKQELLNFIHRKNAEVEKLKSKLDYCENDAEYWEVKCKKVKSEAITEFANKVEQKCLDRGIYPVCVKRVIEQTKKEMTEQRKE